MTDWIFGVFVPLCFIVPLLSLHIAHLIWPNVWYCDKMGWHNGTGEHSFDGCSVHSTCGVCGKEVMQDSQGSWF